MMRALALPLLLLPACAEAQDSAAGWREESAMAGVQYVGRIPDDGGGLIVEGWRNDGGYYVSDDLHSVSVYSTADRVAISAEAFRHREPDGVAAWTIAEFWSYPADREDAGLGLLCGYGPDMTQWSADHTKDVVAIVQWSAVPQDQETHHEGVLAAVEANLVTGELTPIAVDGVYCHQELL